MKKMVYGYAVLMLILGISCGICLVVMGHLFGIAVSSLAVIFIGGWLILRRDFEDAD